jgi:hypothetical protein
MVRAAPLGQINGINLVNCAPVIFLVFKRPEPTRRVFEAIRQARPRRLYVAADGPRERPGEVQACAEVRSIVGEIDWPCQVKTLFRDHNLGTGRAVHSALDWFFGQESEGIILEDDCLPSPPFFRYCTELLERYRYDMRIMSICGSDFLRGQHSTDASYYYSAYHDPWGWATWRRAWMLCDHEMQNWPTFLASGALRALSDGRIEFEDYWTSVFRKMYAGMIDTWDYPFLFSHFAQRGLSCKPLVNMVSNIGFDAEATHTLDTRDPLAELPLGDMGFPLSHPAIMVRDAKADHLLDRLRFGINFVTRTRTRTDRLKQRIRSAVSQVLESAIGEEYLGVLDYLRDPNRGETSRDPFSGQLLRQQLFLYLVAAVKPAAIIETETHLGTTTEFMARQTGLPVFTSELNERNYGFSRMRLRRIYNVSIYKGDSRQCLKRIISDQRPLFSERQLLVYVDAHGKAHLSLSEELDLIFANGLDAVVIIDDFQVPGEIGYGFDRYDPRKTFVRDCILGIMERYDLVDAYPTARSFNESGARRGCVVLARRGTYTRMLEAAPALRRHVASEGTAVVGNRAELA